MKTKLFWLKARIAFFCAAVIAACSSPLLHGQGTYEGAGSEMINIPNIPIQVFGGAPSSVAGGAMLLDAGGTNQLQPLSNGYSLVLFNDSSYTLQSFGGSQIVTNSGLYEFGGTNLAPGEIVLDDSQSNLLAYLLCNFNTASQGSFDSSTSSNDVQTGGFLFAQGTAPAVIEAKVFNCVISNGLNPLAASGNFALNIAPSGGAYKITGSDGVADSTGTYSYALLNQSTAVLQKEDSVSGSITAYYSFITPTNGFYVITQPSTGGFQTGSFTMNANPPATFFAGESSLGGGWYYLSDAADHAFGYYSLAVYPYIYHLDMGWEYFIDAGNSKHGAYFYDFTDQVFFYTEAAVFPYIFDFNRNAWLYYLPVTNIPDRYTTGPRWFYDFGAQAWTTHL